MSDRITILSWDQAPSAALEKLVRTGAQQLASAGSPLPRVWVWLDRRQGTRANANALIYVRLEAELFSATRLDGYRLRVESTGASPEQACRRAFKAITVSAASPALASSSSSDRLPALRRPSSTGVRPASLGSPRTASAVAARY